MHKLQIFNIFLTINIINNIVNFVNKDINYGPQDYQDR
jgi:hypothetical protein